MTTAWISRLLTGLSLALLLGCGGGGGGSSPAPNPPAPAPSPPAPPAPPAPPTTAELNAASLLASQATMGATYEDIVDMATVGPEAWIDAQMTLPTGTHTPQVLDLIARRDAGEFAAVETDVELLVSFRRYVWWHQALSAPDVLRQRVALALSEIFVVSDNVDTLFVFPLAMSTYWDMLLEHSFGNYRDLLKAVAVHPAMGVYLSHVNNRKADPVANTFPDENFAREVMQLFSIGLFMLNQDGSIQTDSGGVPIPTYDNDDIREFAKIFTGLSYGGDGASFGREFPAFVERMQMFDDFHETGSKQLLRGTTVPAGQTGEQDIDAAIDNLFNHPNVGPFIGRLLIQRLVTSNPSPAYIQRIASVFNDNGSGERGDLGAVIKAILLDAEAGTSNATSAGKLREPLLRYTHMLRAFNPESDDGNLYSAGFFVQELLRQHPLSSPSVFNFFLPDHVPAGELADNNLVAPEFQITTSTGIANSTNIVDFVVIADVVADVIDPPFSGVRLVYDDYVALADDVDALLDRLDLVFTYGQMQSATRNVIRDIVADIDDLNIRARLAIYLVLVSPDYAVQS